MNELLLSLYTIGGISLIAGLLCFLIIYKLLKKEQEEIESYPLWVKLNLLINPRTNEIHIVSGDREECSCGCGGTKCDTPYIGLRLLEKSAGIKLL